MNSISKNVENRELRKCVIIQDLSSRDRNPRAFFCVPYASYERGNDYSFFPKYANQTRGTDKSLCSFSG